LVRLSEKPFYRSHRADATSFELLDLTVERMRQLPWLIDNPAGMAFRETVLPPNAFNCLPAPFGAYKFSVTTSLAAPIL
jgi:hypothetical protein